MRKPTTCARTCPAIDTQRQKVTTAAALSPRRQKARGSRCSRKPLVVELRELRCAERLEPPLAGWEPVDELPFGAAGLAVDAVVVLSEARGVSSSDLCSSRSRWVPSHPVKTTRSPTRSGSPCGQGSGSGPRPALSRACRAASALSRTALTFVSATPRSDAIDFNSRRSS